jgi:CHASE3 domain sensor protein
MEKTVPQRGSVVRERTRRLPPCFSTSSRANRLIKLMVDEETGLRGFLLSRNVEDDDVGAIHRARTLLNALQAVAEETEQKPAIEPRFHSIFPRAVW